MARDISMGPAKAAVRASTRPVISWMNDHDDDRDHDVQHARAS